MRVQPKRLPDDAAEAVALHGITCRAHGNCHAEPRAVLVVATCCHREESVAEAPAARIRGVELRLAPQTLVRRESEPVHSLCAESRPVGRSSKSPPAVLRSARPGVATWKVGASIGAFYGISFRRPLARRRA